MINTPYPVKTNTSYWRYRRPKIEDKDNFELKGQFLKELCTNTFSGSNHEDANEHIEKVLEIVDLFHIPNITIDQVMLRAFPMSLIGAILDSRGAIPSKTAGDAKVAIQEMAEYSQNGTMEHLGQEELKLLTDCQLYKHNSTILGERSRKPFQGGGYRAAALGFYQKNNANPSYQERRKSIEDTLSKFMCESAKRHEENSNLIKEIRASTDAAIRNQGASIKTLEIQIGQMSKVLQERGFGSLPSSTKANLRNQVKSISTTIEADSYPIRHIGSSQYAVSTR
ncbi:hypothetical protein Tco_0884259 [Tanacetum coccineum]